MVATDSHIELGVEFPTRTWAMGCCSLSVQQVSIEKVLPLDYSTILLPPLVGVCSVPVSRNEQVAVLPLQSPILSALRELERFFFCGCRARSKLWRSSIHWLRLSIPTHENKVKRYLRCLSSNQRAATNPNKKQEQKPNSPTKKQANNQQETGHLVRRVKHYAFKKVPMPLSTASRWNSNITHICPTNPKVIIHCMWQWYKSYWATPGVGSSYQNCSTVIGTTASRCPINFSQCSSM